MAQLRYCLGRKQPTLNRETAYIFLRLSNEYSHHGKVVDAVDSSPEDELYEKFEGILGDHAADPCLGISRKYDRIELYRRKGTLSLPRAEMVHLSHASAYFSTMVGS